MNWSRLPDLNGLLVIDKPAGMTSHDVVGRVRRIVGMKRVGHGGTLDPFATGILIVAVGRATRLLQHVQDSQKGYRAHVKLGAATDTGDVDGVLVETGERADWPTTDEVVAAVQTFVGEIEQVPPPTRRSRSAAKSSMNWRAPASRSMSLTRIVTIHAIEIIDFSPPDLLLDIRCGKGTYVRSIARDLGALLGTGAYCHGLRRTNSGRFCLADAWTLDALAELDVRDGWPQRTPPRRRAGRHAGRRPRRT